MVAIMMCSWQMRLIIDFFFNSLRSGFLGQGWSCSSLLSFAALESFSLSPKLLTNCIMSATGLSRGFSDTSLRCGKSTNAHILQMFLPLTNSSKSCINDHKLKWAAKEVTSWSQFSQRKNKRTEDQKLNGLKKNLRMLILNTSKFTNRGLQFQFLLPATNKQKNLKPVFATKTYFSCHWNLPICSWRNKTFLSKGLLQTSNYSIQSQDLVTFNVDKAFALFGWKKKVLSLSISLYIDDNHSFCYCVHPG